MRRLWTELPWWVWAAAATVLAVAALGGVVLGRSQQPGTVETGDAGVAVPTSSPVAWRKLTLPAADIWMPFGPDGPSSAATGQWSGWSQTEQGAVQAGWMWLVCAALDNAAAADCVRSHYTGAFTEQVAQLYETRAPVPREEAAPVGYDVLTYTPESARIVYRTRKSTMILGVVWKDGDWKIVASDNESRPRNATQVAPGEEFEFTPWGPSSG